MERQKRQLDGKPDFLKIDKKEEVPSDLIEDQTCMSEVNVDSVMVKEEPCLTSDDSIDIALDNYKQFIKEEPVINCDSFKAMERQKRQLDGKPDFLKIDIKEEVPSELIEDQTCMSEVNVESVIVKEEPCLTSDDSNDIEVDNNKQFIKEEQEFNCDRSEAAVKELDLLSLPDIEYVALPAIKCEDIIHNVEEETTAPSSSCSLTKRSSRKRSTFETDDGKPYKCKECDYSSHQLKYFKKHIKRHTGLRPYKCKECEYSSVELDSLKRHIMHRHTTERPFKCTACHYSTTQFAILKQHMKCHIGERPYMCKECDYAAHQLSNLKRHMKRHTGERPFKCKECNFSAAQLGSLQTHMKNHTGERPYKCKECEFSASCLSTLKRHMRRHTGERPYTCNECDYSSIQLYYLKHHMKKHTGERPYKCKECEFSASCLSTFKRHMRKQHLNIT